MYIIKIKKLTNLIHSYTFRQAHDAVLLDINLDNTEQKNIPDKIFFQSHKYFSGLPQHVDIFDTKISRQFLCQPSNFFHK